MNDGKVDCQRCGVRIQPSRLNLCRGCMDRSLTNLYEVVVIFDNKGQGLRAFHGHKTVLCYANDPETAESDARKDFLNVYSAHAKLWDRLNAKTS